MLCTKMSTSPHRGGVSTCYYITYMHAYLSALRHLVLEHGTEHRRASSQNDLVCLEQPTADRQDHVTEQATLEQLTKILVEGGFGNLGEETGGQQQ